MSRFMSVLFTLLILFAYPLTGSAQDETPPPEGVVLQGRIINRTTNEPGPEGVALMLHIWDEGGSSKGMEHGESGPGGEFQFDDVLVEEGALYVVMATHGGATYFSETVKEMAEGGLPDLEIVIYETTADPTDVSIELVHLVLGVNQGGLAVAEIYFFSNDGDRTLAEAITLDDGSMATLRFTLPPDAANISFPSAASERFEVFPGGFADKNPLVPGERTGQIIVTYILPYEDGLTLVRPVPFDTNEISVLLPIDSDLKINVGAEYKGVKSLGEANEPYDIYSGGPLQRDQQIKVEISGVLSVGLDDLSASESSVGNIKTAVLIGAASLGVVLIGVGVLLWRREEPADVLEDPE